MTVDDGNEKTQEEHPAPQQFIIQIILGERIDIITAPNDFILCLGMLEWAKDKVWEKYRAVQKQSPPTIQMPAPSRWPPKGAA